MALRKASGEMYNFISHLWDPLAGKCGHGCSYCSTDHFKGRFPAVNNKYSGEPRLKENEIMPLGKGKSIFVCSKTDLFARTVPGEIIAQVIHHCSKYPENDYLFQTKNPFRYNTAREWFNSDNMILGTTIESSRNYLVQQQAPKAPSIYDRISSIMRIAEQDFDVFVTIEPILDFDVNDFVALLAMIKPSFVAIGADSKGHGLQEPSYNKVKQLIEQLNDFTEVRVKRNLQRLVE